MMPEAATVVLALAALVVGFLAGCLWSRGRTRREVSRLQEALRHAADEARTDPLTGIGNRKAFDERLQFLSALSHRHQTPFALVLIDVNDLKGVNDRDGHSAGDELLRRLSSALRESIRESDLVARLGGDEFAILLPQTTLEGAQALVSRLLTCDDANARFPVSAGIAAYRPEEAPDELIRRADEALYVAKGRTSGFPG
jgi:diguanylate cyclase (GGDEF)-like protein